MPVRVPVRVQERNETDEGQLRRLREAIDRAGGPTRVSRLSGVPLKSLSNYLAGRDMRLATAVAIAHACKVSVEWLATGENPPAKPPEAKGPPPLFQIVDMGVLDAAIDGAREIFRQRQAQPAGENFARIVCLLYDETKRAKDAHDTGEPRTSHSKITEE